MMNSNRDIIDKFMTRSYEKKIDEQLLSDKNYIVPLKIHNYIDRILSIPYIEFINYNNDQQDVINGTQLTQCSSFAACSSEMCRVLKSLGNPGLRFVEIGQLFPQYVRVNNESAYRKYGENQIKTSAQLGLTFEYYGYWYLSCVGYIYNDLNELQQKSLLARTILRIPLYHEILKRIIKEIVNITEYMQSLSDTTKGRRSGSIMKMINICLEECKRNGLPFHDLYYPCYIASKKSIRLDKQIGTFNIMGEDLFKGNPNELGSSNTINISYLQPEGEEYLMAAEREGDYKN